MEFESDIGFGKVLEVLKEAERGKKEGRKRMSAERHNMDFTWPSEIC